VAGNSALTVYGILIFALVLASTGVLLAASLSLLLMRSILCPPRMTDGKAVYVLHRLSPGDLGLMFDNQWFTVRDERGKELKIAGWWISAAQPSRKCVVLIHGYADAKVGSIAWAPLLHQAGANILAIDLRAHGESGGKFCTAGFFEREDVNQLINQLLNIRPEETGQLALFGISLGAAVAAAVAAGRDDLSAVILESPFADYRRAVAAHAELMGLPRGIILRTAIAGAQWMSGSRFDAVRPVDAIPRIRCPVLSIIGVEDDLLSSDDIAAVRSAMDQQNAIQPASRFWLVEGAGHLTAMQTSPLEYRRRVEDILSGSSSMLKEEIGSQ
jgi:pimeloyl-ACP methyl ester carboxylesterase